METTSIKNIKDLCDSISANLENYKAYHKSQGSDMLSAKYGSENEYCIKSVIAGIKNILTDLRFLTRSHDLFVKISTYNERNNLYSSLSNLNSYLSNKNTTHIVTYIEEVKTRLRFYNARIDKGRLLDFNTEIDNLRRVAIELEDEISKVKEKLVECKKLNREIETTQEDTDKIIVEISDKADSFTEEYNSFVEKHSDFQELAQKAQSNEKAISEILEKVNSEKEDFDEFIEKITEREKALSKQADSTNEYEKKLELFSQEHESRLNEAERLIEEAKKALNYKNAEGLSAAFNTQLTSASSKLATLGWIIGAAAFIIATLIIGIWIVAGWGIDSTANENQMWFSLIGRLSMIPLTITAAVFCANQYTKQKNIIEDYAYKTTIAKSIIAFSEELRNKDSEKYAEYISTILKEIHQDPLRKRDKGTDNFKINKESARIIEKVISLLQTAINK